MAPTGNTFRAFRPIFHSHFMHAPARNALRGGRRFHSTAARADAEAIKESLLQRLWNSPVGVKTVHFWAPVMKWALVIAGISDLARPAEKLSLTQNAALTATGLIWTRWCLIIKPKNYLLAAVNFFLGLVGVVQVGRILNYNSSQKGLPAAVGDAANDLKEGEGKRMKEEVDEAKPTVDV